MHPKLTDSKASVALLDELHDRLYQLYREGEPAVYVKEMNEGVFYKYACFLKKDA